MLERMRDTWTKAIQPIVLKLGDLDPSVLTWTSLLVSVVGFYMLAIAEMDTNGSLMIILAVILIVFI